MNHSQRYWLFQYLVFDRFGWHLIRLKFTRPCGNFHLEMQPVDTSFLNIHGLPWQTLLVYLSWGFSRFCFYTYSEIPSRIRLSPSQAFRFSYPTFLQPCITKAQDLVRFYHHFPKGMTLLCGLGTLWPSGTCFSLALWGVTGDQIRHRIGTFKPISDRSFQSDIKSCINDAKSDWLFTNVGV